MPPLSPPQTAYGLVYVGGPNVGKEQKRKAYSAADRSFADNNRKKKRSITPAIAATVTKRRIEAGDTRRRQLIFKEVYASLKKQLSHRERNGSGTRAERGQVLTK